MYYNVNMVYEDTSCVCFFFFFKCQKFSVLARFRCMLGVSLGDRIYSLYGIKTITPTESPHKPHIQVCVCMCVWFRYSLRYGDKMAISEISVLVGTFLVPMRQKKNHNK